jgi:hypothetical protein
MQYYNIHEARTLTREQAEARLSKTAPTGNPTDAQLAADGSLPFTPLPADPEGFCEVAGTRLTVHNKLAAWERCDYETIADKEARDAAAAIDAAAQRKSAMAAKLTVGIVGLAVAYRAALRAMFGEGAETNRDITKEIVTGTMLQLPKEQYDAKTADMLKLAFEELSAIAGDGTTWTLFETVGDLIPEVVA